MRKLRNILLVEDSPNDRELIIEGLKDMNVANSIDVACDGTEALDYLYKREKFLGRETGHPAVILLDIKMPKMNGLEVLEVIKNDDELKRLPVVMLTSSREESDLARSYELGVNAYVVKPVDFGEFMTAVKELGIFWGLLNEVPDV